jgi:hypothetical protein
MVKKSLKTRDKQIALNLARKLICKFYLEITACDVNSVLKDQIKEMFNLDEHEKALHEDYERSRLISIAIRVTDQYDGLNDLEYEREMFWDMLSQEEHCALQYVSDNGISLDDYRSGAKADKLPEAPKAQKDSQLLSKLLDSYIEQKKLDKPNWTLKGEANIKWIINIFVFIVGDKQSANLVRDDITFL